VAAKAVFVADQIVVIPTPLPGAWRLALSFCDQQLCAMDFVDSHTDLVEAKTPQHWLAVQAVLDYFEDPARVRPLPQMRLQATPFQQRVWQALCDIPCGETRSYGALARQLQTSARALAGACRANPVPILVPCHRVVAIHGPGGYMGETDGPALAIKQWLLHHEQHAR
jgi:methylated-DNA-[protein]-cysteine S-methyltransferase